MKSGRGMLAVSLKPWDLLNIVHTYRTARSPQAARKTSPDEPPAACAVSGATALTLALAFRLKPTRSSMSKEWTPISRYRET